MQDPAIQAIKESAIFCGLRDEDLLELVSGGKRLQADPGDCLIAEGDPGDSLLVIISGEVEVVRDTGDGEASLARMGPGAFVGEMALIDNAPRSATVRALTKSEVLEITKAQFDRLLDESPDACRTLVRTILRRLKSTEAMLVNQEKMAALGRISAGLAHELNNPASAVGRFAAQIIASFEEWQRASRSLASEESPVKFEHLVLTALNKSAASADSDRAPRSALEQADLEDSLIDWMEAHGVEDPWNAAANLASVGWTPGDLDSLARDIPGAGLSLTIDWLSSEAAVRVTLGELRTGAERLSEIVASVKSYSHMDRAPIERLNLNQGLESTLVILRHKMRDVEVILDLDPDLPEIEGYPAELNQVWTNLIDNAVDAMHGSGTLTIQSFRDGDHAVVTMTDSGGGISKEHQKRLFEPFFTTKEVGVGTGLGLHISHNIVVQRHGGKIEVDSVPGRTTFTVSLPVGS